MSMGGGNSYAPGETAGMPDSVWRSMGMGNIGMPGGAGGGLLGSIGPLLSVAQGKYGSGIGSLVGGGLLGEGLLGGTLGSIGTSLGAGALGSTLGAFAGPLGMIAGGLIGSLFDKKNSPPIRDIAAAYSQGLPISDASWAKAGLPPGGGPQWQQAVAQATALGPLSGLFQGHNNATMDQQQAILMNATRLPMGSAVASGGTGGTPGSMGAPAFTPPATAAPLRPVMQPNFQYGQMRSPQFMQLAQQRFPSLLG